VTDLQVAIVAGAAIVLAWVLFANFRDRKAADRLVERNPPTLQEEPVMLAPAERGEQGETPSDLSESIALLTWQEPISVSRVEAELRGVRRVGSKPLLFGWISAAGTNASPHPSAERVSQLQIGVLLATRSGPLHAMEYTEWQELAARLGASLGAHVSIPQMSEVLAKARALDQQCAAVDAQLSIVIRADQVLTASAISQAALLAGLEQRGESRYALGAIGQQRFSVFPGDSGETLVLLLDVPRTLEPQRAYQEMVKTAQTMSEALSARLCDDSGRSLAAKDFELIADQVAAKEQQLQHAGIAPGSPVALRLFL
jgi:hypothetical protein